MLDGAPKFVIRIYRMQSVCCFDLFFLFRRSRRSLDGVDIISVSSSSATYELGRFRHGLYIGGGKDFEAQTVMALDELA